VCLPQKCVYLKSVSTPKVCLPPKSLINQSECLKAKFYEVVATTEWSSWTQDSGRFGLSSAVL